MTNTEEETTIQVKLQLQEQVREYIQGVNLKTFNANISENKKVRKTQFGTNVIQVGGTRTTIFWLWGE